MYENMGMQIIRWMTATERILLCMTGSSMSRNAVVVSEIVEKMHLLDNESYKGGSNPPSIFCELIRCLLLRFTYPNESMP